VKMDCPISNVEKRLQDAGSFWQSAHDSYFDPDVFRRNVQSSIQTFRTVTWVLQNAKASIPKFDVWYKEKQDKMREDMRLKWLVDARNHIEKQGDLDTHSKFIIERTDSWLPGEKRTIMLPPSIRPEDIIKTIAAKYPESKCREGSILKVSREWVDSEMPDEEVLSLLVHAYSKLQDMIIEVHELLPCEIRDACEFYQIRKSHSSHLPEGMDKLHFPAVAWFSLERGILKEYGETIETVTREDIEKTVRERYGDFGGIDIGPSSQSSFKKICDDFFEIGKKMLIKDGYHLMIALIHTEKGFFSVELRPEDRADKHVLIRELASKCARLRAVSCILIGEVWAAVYSPRHGPHAVGHPDRQEELFLAAYHKDEGFITREAIFRREGDTIVFSDGDTAKYMHASILNPVVDAIRKEWS